MTRTLPSNARLIPPQAKRVFKGVIYDVYQWDQAMFDGTTEVFEMLKRPDTVIIIGIKDDKVIYIEDVQPNDYHTIGFPGGRVDPDESWVDAAKREMLEETGLSFSKWKLVNVFQPISKAEWFVACYVAWEVSGTSTPHLDSGEKITVKLAPVAEACKEIRADEKNKGRSDIPDSVAFAKDVSELINLPDCKELYSS